MAREVMAKRRLVDGERADVRGRYAHCSAEDIFVWRSFLRQAGVEEWEVWYDVHVGRAVELPPGVPEWMSAVAQAVTRKRVDVVARVPGGYWIIELKPYGNMVGVGQAIMYRDLVLEEFDLSGVVEGVLICLQVDVDIVEVARREGVKIIAMEGLLL